MILTTRLQAAYRLLLKVNRSQHLQTTSFVVKAPRQPVVVAASATTVPVVAVEMQEQVDLEDTSLTIAVVFPMITAVLADMHWHTIQSPIRSFLDQVVVQVTRTTPATLPLTE